MCSNVPLTPRTVGEVRSYSDSEKPASHAVRLNVFLLLGNISFGACAHSDSQGIKGGVLMLTAKNNQTWSCAELVVKTGILISCTGTRSTIMLSKREEELVSSFI